MEPPAKDLSQLRFNLLLQRLSLLPSELREPILLDLSYSQLKALCEASSSKLTGVAEFCNDVNFWRDYILTRGFLLPERFTELVNFLEPRPKKQIALLQTWFFEDLPNRKTIANLMIQKWNQKVRNSRDEAPTGPIREFLLDFEYLWRQIGIYHRRPKPIVFNIRLSNKSQNSLFLSQLRLQNKFSYSDFLEWLVQDGVELSSQDSSLISEWISNHLRLDRFYFNEESPMRLFIEKMEEQALVLINDLLRKGDLVHIAQIEISPESMNYIGDSVYFYFDGRELIDISEQQVSVNRSCAILPEEALPYLIARKISTKKDLRELYILDDRDYLCGFVYLDQVYLLSNNKSKELKIDNHIFYIE
jgi:hypothetical protein